MSAGILDDLPRTPEEGPETRPLPEIEDAATFTEIDLPVPQELVQGILHRESKMVLGGPSKSCKTWSLLDLALSVSHGEPWWSLKTTQAKVLFLNLEVQRPFFQKRLQAVAREKRIQIKPGHLDVWNLRGHSAEYSTILPKIKERIQAVGYGLIILDPVYKLYGSADENKAGDISRLMNSVEDLAVQAAAAVVFGAHFSKGNQAAKDSIDRISGSGVFARDPDSILCLTKHKVEGAFTVDATLRNFRPMESFCVHWDYPLMRRVDLDPKELKQPAGRKTEHTTDDLLNVLPEEGATYSEWFKLASTGTKKMSETTFKRRLEEAEKGGLVSKNDGKWVPGGQKVQKGHN